MKKITTFWLLILISFTLNANIHIVTSTGDNKSNPTEGMLRYFVENSNSGDTIRFSIDSVGLDTTIRISYKKLTIDGGDGVIIDGNSNGTVFNISAGSGDDILLKGLIIQNGYGNNYGGGMYLFMTANVVVVENCTFRNNTVFSNSDSQGGGIRTNGGTFRNCYFIENQAIGTNNVCGGGGALAVGGKFINCVFAGNNAKYGGGISASGTTITNCTFTQNTVDLADNGGGVSAENACEVTNCIIYNNKANNIENNIVSYSSLITYCALENGNSLVYTNGNIGLLAAPFTHTQPDSLSLKEGSSCINAGNSFVANLPEKDIIGNKRIFGTAVDMGAYEFIKPTTISGVAKTESDSILTNYVLHASIITDGGGNYQFITGQNGIEIGDTIELNAPNGYGFYPKKIIVGETDLTINIIAYKGIVIDEANYSKDTINWNTDTVNVFCDVVLDSSNLNINANTKIKFHGYYGIRVSGTGNIMAIGTFNEPIIFTAADTAGLQPTYFWSTDGAWNKIVFDNMSPNADSSIFEFCTIQFSKGTSECGDESSAVIISQSNKISFTNCKFANNYALPKNCSSGMLGGGALRILNSNITINNCSFYNNHCKGDGANIYGGGGAIYIYNGDVRIVNCTFVRNNAIDVNGGAICSNSALVNIYNSIFYNNNDYYGSNSLEGSSFNIYNCNVEGGNSFFAEIYQNCIDSDPKFVDITKGDFSLLPNSPCINGGNLDSVLSIISNVDINGTYRVHQNLIDIGTSEYQQDISLTISGYVTKENGDAIANFTLFSNIETDASGSFVINVEDAGLNIGDTVVFNNLSGYEFYPDRIVVVWDKPRDIHLVAYKGIVIDENDVFESNITWNVDTVNVFKDINLSNINLFIEQGTVIRFHKYAGINISGAGSILAQGTNTDSIIFTTAYPELSDPSNFQLYNSWKGISFNNANQYTQKSIFSFCKIEFAKKESAGGGVYINNFSPIKFNNCEFNRNRGKAGGGICIYSSNIEIFNSSISYNIDANKNGWWPTLGGGGIYISNSNPKIVGCVISNNNAYWHGGGILLANSNPFFINCSVINNTCGDKGEAIYLYESSPDIYNTILYGTKTFQLEAYEINSYSENTKVFNSCIRGGNRLSASTYENCINENPLFSDIANSDFTLLSNSPCRNMGTIALPFDIENTDIVGNQRIMGDSIDAGANEFMETTLFAASGDAVVDIPVQFNAEVLLGTVNSWSWDFDADGIEDANTQNPDHVFNDTGTYVVRLIADIVEFGKTDTVFISLKVYNAVVADFSVNDTSGSAPFYVVFSDSSYNNPTSWFWDFGDGKTSNLQNPVHIYEENGEYSVTLISSNSAISDTLIKTKHIEVIDGYLMKSGSYITDKGYFYDDGGAYNNYDINKNDTLTFLPFSDKCALSFDFKEFKTMYSSDYLKVYDGNSTLAPLIGSFDWYDNVGILSASNSEGALTFVFSSGIYNWCSGWKAKISTIPMYDLEFNSNDNGYVVGDTSQLIVAGNSSAAVTAVADNGFHFSKWVSISGDSISIDNPLTITEVISDTTLLAVFEINTYEVNFGTLGNGTIEGDAYQSVTHGLDASSVEAIANTGYHFVKWQSATGDSISSDNPLLVTGVINDTNLFAVFEINTYEVNFGTLGNGTIEGDAYQSVTHGLDASSVEAIANTGYHFVKWQSITGDSITNENPLIVTNITTDSSLVAIFSQIINSVIDLNTNDIVVYPNPVKDILTIKAADAIRIELRSINGEVLQIINETSYITTLNMNKYSSGIYLLALVSSKNKIHVIKLVKD